ncbi:TPA: hypothetical protein N0F65_009073 [Lagenidium giganteum]|uniref:WW domain-containing protein n=1 Tax=Lagenidium giganteum TaxID=4803 RepID=A0AAV2YQZ8_9STRA|nr:TPA: hypothetical protein N0F65_009073 [Lagenidium giganteum]
MTVPAFRHIRIAGDDRALYENFFRSFPRPLVTKPRFVSIIRSIFGMDEGMQRRKRKEEVALCHHLDHLQYMFEQSTEPVPTTNWRLLLSAMRMFQEPHLPLRQHLAWTFGLFSSSSYIELHETSTIHTSDVRLLLTHFLRNHAAIDFVTKRFFEAQAMLSVSGSGSRMTFLRFKELLTQPPLRVLFEHATEYTLFLEELASPVYRRNVYKRRKHDADVRKIQRLRYFHETKRVRACLVALYEFARIQKRSRFIVAQALVNLEKAKRQRAFRRMHAFTMASIAAIEIQRMYRGFVGRAVAFEQWRRVQAAICVQGAYRARSHFTKHLRQLKRKNCLAIRIQRIYRGRQGRVHVRKRLIEHYHDEMAAIQREREEFRAFVRNEMAKKIQRLFRELVRERRKARAEREAAERWRVEREMAAQAAQAVRDREEYRRRLTAAFDRVRDEYFAKKERAVIDAAEKKKVIRLRRQRQWDAFKQEKIVKKEKFKQEAAAEYEALRQDWVAKIESRTHQRKMLVSQLVLVDETLEHKALHAQLKHRQHEHERALAAKYKGVGVVVTKREVEERAQAAVVAEESAKEQASGETDWLQAEADFLRLLEEREEEQLLKANAEERIKRARSTLKIQTVYRRFAARQLLRQEIREAFVKEFNVEKMRAVYRHVLMGEVSERKPYGLGSTDLEYPDKWIMVRDQQLDEVYYYNPRTLVQSWDCPAECRLCGSCAPESPSFAAFWNPQDDSFVCRSCYEERAHAPDFIADMYFAYDGSRRDE